MLLYKSSKEIAQCSFCKQETTLYLQFHLVGTSCTTSSGSAPMVPFICCEQYQACIQFLQWPTRGLALLQMLLKPVVCFFMSLMLNCRVWAEQGMLVHDRQCVTTAIKFRTLPARTKTGTSFGMSHCAITSFKKSSTLSALWPRGMHLHAKVWLWAARFPSSIWQVNDKQLSLLQDVQPSVVIEQHSPHCWNDATVHISLVLRTSLELQTGIMLFCLGQCILEPQLQWDLEIPFLRWLGTNENLSQ